MKQKNIVFIRQLSFKMGKRNMVVLAQQITQQSTLDIDIEWKIILITLENLKMVPWNSRLELAISIDRMRL